MKTIVYQTATSGYTAEERDRRLSFLNSWLPDGAKVQIRFPEQGGGPAFLDRAEDFGTAIDNAVETAKTYSPSEVDAVILGGALDPGVEAVREVTSIPIIGPGECSLFVASCVGRPLSVVTVDEHAVAAAETFVKQTRTKPRVVSIRSMETPVRQIVGNLDRGRDALRRQSRLAIEEDGAEALYLGSMTLPTLGLAEALREELGVPVYDPVQLSVQSALQCLQSLK